MTPFLGFLASAELMACTLAIEIVFKEFFAPNFSSVENCSPIWYDSILEIFVGKIKGARTFPAENEVV